MIYPQYENDLDGFDDYVECVTRYVLSHIDISEITDIYELIDDFVNPDDGWHSEADEIYTK